MTKRRKSAYTAGRTLYRALQNCWSTAPGLEHDERLIPAGTDGLTFDHLNATTRQALVNMGAIEAYTETIAETAKPAPAPAPVVLEENDNG